MSINSNSNLTAINVNSNHFHSALALKSESSHSNDFTQTQYFISSHPFSWHSISQVPTASFIIFGIICFIKAKFNGFTSMAGRLILQTGP